MNKKEWIILFICSLMQFVGSLTVNLLTIALPYIGNDLAMPITLQNQLGLVLMLSMAAFSFPYSAYLNKIGLKKAGLLTSVLAIVFLIMSALSINYNMLIYFRFIQGIFIGGLYIISTVILAKSIPKSTLGSALGIFAASGYVGVSLAPSITGLLLNFVSWRYIFLLPIIILFVIIILLTRVTFDNKVDKTPNDYKGSILWCLGTFCFIYGLSNLDFVYLTIIGIILYIIFYLYEKKIDHPLYNVKLFKNIDYTFANITALFMCIITHSTPLLLSYLATYYYSINPAITGMFLLITPVCQIIVAPFGGKLADKIDTRKIMPISFIIISISITLLLFLHQLTIETLILALVLQSIAYGIYSPANGKFVIISVDNKYLTEVNSLLSNIKNIGNSISMAIVNLAFLLIISTQPLESNLMILRYSVDLVFIIFIAISILGFILTCYTAFIKKSNKEIS